MRTIILILAILLIGLSCKRQIIKKYHICGKDTIEIKVNTPDYHIKVLPYGNGGFWVIHFTNDGWDSFEDINEFKPEIYDYSTLLFWTKNGAVLFAKQFTSYEKCKQFNSDQYKKYKEQKDQKEQIVY